MFLYLDESGDLGWNFSCVGAGSSSRFLTLAFMLVPADKRQIPKRAIRQMYERYGWNSKIEKKGSQLTHQQKLQFCSDAKQLALKHPDIRLRAITVRKECVQAHIRTDPNKLYNFMIKLCILKQLVRFSEVTFVRDARSIKVESGNSLADYLQTELWCALGAETVLRCQAEDSSKNKNLMFVDYLAHCVWRVYERNDRSLLAALGPAVHRSTLYFNSPVIADSSRPPRS